MIVKYLKINKKQITYKFILLIKQQKSKLKVVQSKNN